MCQSYNYESSKKYKSQSEGIRMNPLLSKVLHYVKMEWPQKVEPALSPYFAWINKMTIEHFLLRGIQVVAPPNLHKRVLELLHEPRLGVVNIKAGQDHIYIGLE